MTVNTVSVSQFISQINDIIAGQFVIEGEVSQFKVSAGKWIFFDLKDEVATLNCFSTVFMLKTPLEDGMRVRVSGYPKIHDKSGRFSFTVQTVELVGEGALARAYKLLKQKLTDEGLFAPERKRTLPKFPERIGVIASRDSAAWGDFKRIAANRWGGVEMVLRHTVVQGESAAADIVQAVQEFNESKELPEVLIIIRGGGSLEDLAAFNNEAVVRAVAASRIPTVSGVGHERDETLIDFVSDVRASTPSNAAERVLPERREIVSELEFSVEQMRNNLEQVVSSKLHEIVARESLMKHYLDKEVARAWSLVTNAERLFKNLDPKQVLARGYSITRTFAGRILKRSSAVDIGDTVVVELASGKLINTVTKKS